MDNKGTHEAIPEYVEGMGTIIEGVESTGKV